MKDAEVACRLVSKYKKNKGRNAKWINEFKKL
jgi:hypothetical protein